MWEYTLPGSQTSKIISKYSWLYLNWNCSPRRQILCHYIPLGLGPWHTTLTQPTLMETSPLRFHPQYHEEKNVLLIACFQIFFCEQKVNLSMFGSSFYHSLTKTKSQFWSPFSLIEVGSQKLKHETSCRTLCPDSTCHYFDITFSLFDSWRKKPSPPPKKTTSKQIIKWFRFDHMPTLRSQHKSMKPRVPRVASQCLDWGYWTNWISRWLMLLVCSCKNAGSLFKLNLFFKCLYTYSPFQLLICQFQTMSNSSSRMSFFGVSRALKIKT